MMRAAVLLGALAALGAVMVVTRRFADALTAAWQVARPVCPPRRGAP